LGTDILLNGVSTGNTTSVGFGAWTPFTISAPSGLPSGSNTLDFQVQNVGDNPTGVRVEITGITLGP